MTKQIPLNLGQVTTVCDCHAHLVEGYKWYARLSYHTKAYHVERHSSLLERLAGAPRMINMHGVINGTPKGMKTDHKNRNTLDNQCTNLRTVTTSQNAMNREKQSNNKSGFKGVHFDKRIGKWRALIQLNGKEKHLGYFSSAEQASEAYKKAARELHGEFANLS